MTDHKKLRELCSFQNWLATDYTTLPSDSGEMTKRARLFEKEQSATELHYRSTKSVDLGDGHKERLRDDRVKIIDSSTGKELWFSKAEADAKYRFEQDNQSIVEQFKAMEELCKGECVNCDEVKTVHSMCMGCIKKMAVDYHEAQLREIYSECLNGTDLSDALTIIESYWKPK